MIINFAYDDAGNLRILFSNPVSISNAPAGVMLFGTTSDGRIIQNTNDNITSLTLLKGLFK